MVHPNPHPADRAAGATPATPACTRACAPANPAAPAGFRRGRRQRGMTLVELAAAAAGLATLMAGLVWTSNSLRISQAEGQTRQKLAILRGALVRYHAANHVWPPGPAHAALETLAAHPTLAPVLKEAGLSRDAAGRLFVRDGFGEPLHYFAPGDDAWASPDFVSAGPDGLLGDPHDNRPGRSDNIHGSDTETTGS